ncbi:hypothetical protein [Escherichia phage EK010]|uniref:DUF7247 domain-containing protein n=1 Tax=Escherichia phage EK010 TaxID=2742112 RepID=A0A6J4EH29_9CAUD|nr:hypothetical protein PQC42_gp012 [Escherichia phage EK010]UYE90006.1 hypothetical protein [Escherichia phage E20-1]BCG44939.1 hypothetical protein [Escherichia phage EK010]
MINLNIRRGFYPKVSFRAQLEQLPGVTFLEFTYSCGRDNPGFTVTIESGWFNMTIMPEDVNNALRGIKSGGLNLLAPKVGDELLTVIRNGVDKTAKMVEALK